MELRTARSRQAEAAQLLLARRKARTSVLDFLRFCWWMPHPLIVGLHTREIAARLDLAVERYLRGESTFLDIAVPFRHGKSDLVSRALPAYFIGRCFDLCPDVLQTGYGDALVREFSRDVQKIVRSEKFRQVFPGVEVSDRDATECWSVKRSSGRITATGLGGAITGKGGNLIVIDDYCKSRAEARSEVYRARVWDAFVNDVMTRRAPASIVIVCATPWHVDDLRGRIHREMEKNMDFPRFEHVKFPARNPDGTWLFAERFSDEWYRSQYAALGKFASGLLDCEPMVEGGNRFKTEVGVNVHVHDTLDGWPELREVRGWDLASSEKERDKDDPDWTWGVRGGVVTKSRDVQGETFREHHLWIRDAVYCQAEAPERDRMIRSTAAKDGTGVSQHVEAVAGYKDTYTILRDLLDGVAVVRRSAIPGDKAAKLAPLEPAFEAGHVHMLRGAWNAPLLKQFAEFPDGGHDDGCDATGIMFHACAGRARPSIA